MERNVIKLILPLLLAFVTVCQAETWESISQNASQLQSVRAGFVQEKHLEILARPLISKGTFIFQSPSSLRWEYETPIKSIMMMHNGKSKKFIQKGDELIEEQGMSFESMQIVLQEITHWLNGRFTNNPVFNASLENDRRIVFTPKDPAITQFINKIELKLSDQPSLMDSVTIYEGASSFTRLTFNNAEINHKLETSLFTKK